MPQNDFKNAQLICYADTSGVPRMALVDGKSGAFTTIDSAHHEMHEGDMYTMFITGSDVGDTEKIEIALQPPDSTERFHIVWEFETEGAGNFNVYEGVTLLTSGMTFAPLNRDRNSNKTSNAILAKRAHPTSAFGYNTPTSGTTIWSEHFGSGKQRGGQNRTEEEWILLNNAITVFSLQSEAASSDVALAVTWYAHEDSSP